MKTGVGVPKSRKRKNAKKPKPSPRVKRVGDKKYVQMLDEHGHPRTYELPDVSKEKKH